jgi:predicted permease
MPGLMFSRRRRYEEIAESIREHLDETIADLMDHGMTLEDAQRTAHLKFGDVTVIEERSREVWQWPVLDSLRIETEDALHRMRRAPRFTVIALLILGVAIGANTMIFSLLNGVLFKPLPYPHPERLLAVNHQSQQEGFKNMGISPSLYFIYREQNTTLSDIGAYDHDELDVTGSTTPERVRVLDVTDGTLTLLGVTPFQGRLFTRKDDSPSAAQTVLLTYPYWHKRFGATSSVVGKSITVGGVSREIIGVLPQDFHFLDQKDPSLILPMRWDRSTTTLGNFDANAIASLRPGVTIEQATTNLAGLLPVALKTFSTPAGVSDDFYRALHLAPSLLPLKTQVLGNVQNSLWILLAAAVLVLFVACANVANLLIAQIEVRCDEFALRYVIGGKRKDFSTTILVESALIGIAGSIIGLLLAYGALHIIVRFEGADIPRIRDIAITPLVLLFNSSVAVVAFLLIACAPILQSSGLHLASHLQERRDGERQSRKGWIAAKVLVTLQIALSVVLLVCSGLMFRSVRAMLRVSPGFTLPENIQTFGFYIPETQIPDTSPDLVIQRDQALLEKIAAIPGVSAVSLGRSVPMDSNSYKNPVYVQKHNEGDGKVPPSRSFNFVAPGFFSALGTRLIVGRDFTWSDIYNRKPVVVVSKVFASEYWPQAQDALGQKIRVTSTDTWRDIVGVSEDVRYDGVKDPAPAMVYWPLMMDNFAGQEHKLQRATVFVVRRREGSTQGFFEDIQQQVGTVIPNVPLANNETLADLYTKSMARTTFTLVMLCVFAGMALALGTLGIFSVIAYSIVQRPRRLVSSVGSLAQRQSVLETSIRQGMSLTLPGIAIGLAIAFITMRFMPAPLFGVSAHDPLTYIATTWAVASAALLGCYLPARRIASSESLERSPN